MPSGGSLDHLAIAGRRPLQRLNRRKDALPCRLTVEVAGREPFVGPHGGLSRGVGAVPLYQKPRHAPDVDLGNHRSYAGAGANRSGSSLRTLLTRDETDQTSI